MNLKNNIIYKLASAGGKTVSATELCGSLSRNAVWKAVQTLKDEGYPIESVSGRGYTMTKAVDFAVAEDIQSRLGGKYRIEVLDYALSTNSLLRRMADEGEESGTVIIAKRQTSGRGRMGRSFHSAEGGLYMSLLLRPNLEASRGGDITAAAAVAVAKAVEAVWGKRVYIKWVNDIFAGGKKVCGILTEGGVDMESGMLNYAVVGIGLNVYAPREGFPAELAGIAGALYDCEDKRFGLINDLACRIIANLEVALENDMETLEEYKKRCFVIGQKALAVRGNEEQKVLIKDVNGDYALVAETEEGEVRVLSTGEVRIKPQQIPQ